MALQNIYILGSGGMAREVFSVYVDLKLLERVKGFIDQNESMKSHKVHGRPILSEDEIPSLLDDSVFIGAIGNPLRERWIGSLEKKGCKFDSVVHPSAQVGENTKIEKGSILMSNTVLTTDIAIGSHTIINVASSIGHDTQINSFVTICPGSHIGGYVKIGKGSFIGIGAVIKNNITIGSSSFIGAGAVVVEDVPDNTLVFGNPARHVRELHKEDWKTLLQ